MSGEAWPLRHTRAGPGRRQHACAHQGFQDNALVGLPGRLQEVEVCDTLQENLRRNMKQTAHSHGGEHPFVSNSKLRNCDIERVPC